MILQQFFTVLKVARDSYFAWSRIDPIESDPRRGQNGARAIVGMAPNSTTRARLGKQQFELRFSGKFKVSIMRLLKVINEHLGCRRKYHSGGASIIPENPASVKSFSACRLIRASQFPFQVNRPCLTRLFRATVKTSWPPSYKYSNKVSRALQVSAKLKELTIYLIDSTLSSTNVTRENLLLLGLVSLSLAAKVG